MLISASFTPFKKDFSLNLDLVESLYKNLIHQKVAGTMVCGTTGEGYSMSNDERKQLVEAWKGCIDDDFKLYVHVGHNSIPDIKDLSTHAIGQGVEALVFSAPTFFKPADVKDLVLFLKEAVIDDAGIKIYYYHIPSMTGVDFNMMSMLQAAETYGLPLTGIKYTHDNLKDFEKCLQYKEGKYDVMFGKDENLLEALGLGAKTALGSTYNYMADIFNKILTQHAKGDNEAALTLQKEARTIIDVLIKYGGGVVGGKGFMNLIGLDCGPVRLPLKSLSQAQLDGLKSELENTTFNEHINLKQSKPIEI